MADREVTLTAEAYEALEQRRGEGESLSDVVLEIVDEERGLAHGDGIDQGDLSEEERAVLDQIETQLAATEEQDVMGYLETMHPQARTQQLQQMLVQTWSQYDLTYEFTIEEIDVDGDEATATLLQTTEKVDGPAFQDNTLRERYEFVRDDGEWWMTESTTVDQEFH